ncbi:MULTISPECIES: glutamate 5-kinase [Alphaproteobacteria]|uniref:Glutamate 5-kinase n=2 Tax=Sulfitobacter TaxID=60136 RepID=A0AAX3AEE9_9RHOB|nr:MULTISPECIES: glutamate 5-kinase [Sulfitobacter]MAB16166.1 glutamate 5-kinase [Roseobacter sp.]MCP3879936.1 glutamate 5-kinase [Sulfitobacter sp.]AXI51718.1 glutamate 5-kinase [Sulfitobacter sp. SK025]EAP81706.1 gamma-glutamyl kinase [Sulfitobacter sp. NAS-14.1]MAN09724.1 glutamate 5-kinase [Roseobacter sp.]
MSKKKRIVVKIGSSLLANEEKLTLRYAFMNGLMADLGDLQDQGYEIILTSSGSVALGLNMIGKRPEEAGILDKQAAAACGQPLLMNAYRQVANEYNFDVAQMLVTVEDMEERRRFLNIKNTMLRLFENQILPIINENDSIATRDLKVGDNDRLSAKVAQMVEADHLIILTSVEGLYDRDPSEPGAQFIEEIEDVSEHLESTKSISELGSGGMLTKMLAANMAQNAGVETIIADGIIERPISSVLNNERRHTRCLASGKAASPLMIWLSNRLQVAGTLVVTDEAVRAITAKERGLQRDDLVSIQGEFSKGDVLHVYDEQGNEFARGLTNFSSEETILMARNPEMEIEDVIGYKTKSAVVGAENILILEDHHLQLDAPEEDDKPVISL